MSPVERDAARYRWLRDRIDLNCVREAAFDYPTGCDLYVPDRAMTRKVDLAIDCELRKGGKS